MLHTVLYFMGVMRVLLGLAPFVLPELSSKWLGIPQSHDNPSARLMARLFGVRDVGLGVLVFWALSENPSALLFVLGFNAATDFGDLIATAIPLVRRQGIDRAALTSAGFALTAGVGWLVVLNLARGLQAATAGL